MAQPALSNPTEKRDRRRKTVVWLLAATGAVIACLFAFVLLVRNNSYFRSYRLPSNAMAPTYPAGSTVLTDLRAYKSSAPKYGDVIVFHPPARAVMQNMDAKDLVYISRCIGESGDLIEVREGVLYRNGKTVDEPYVSHAWGGDTMAWDFKLSKHKGEVWPILWNPGELPNSGLYLALDFQIKDEAEGKALAALPPVKIPPGFVLTMGDNREESFDGRMWGPLPISNVVGRVAMKVQ